MLINDVPIERGAAVLALAEPILVHLARAGLTDLIINRAGILQVETDTGWQRIEDPALDHGKLMALTTAIATYSRQKIGAVRPILSASLPTGERIQMIVPPAVEPDKVSFTIRKPSPDTRTMDQYVKDGLFESTRWRARDAKRDQLERKDLELLDRLDVRDFPQFWREAVLQHRNIAIVGATGSGKTLFMRMLCNLIPDQEHLITIEDVRELFLPHSNVDHLLYSAGGQGEAEITPSDLLSACMRMKPDRVLLAELRGAESYDFLKLLTNGHDGAITSYHAGSPQAAIARFILMAKQHKEAASYQAADLKHLFFSAIDIVAHMDVEKIYDGDGQQIGRRWRMTEIYFDPVKKLEFAYDV